MVEVGKISIISLVLFFIGYIVIHYLIAKSFENNKKSLDSDKENIELQKKVKNLQFWNKWFPTFYVVIVIILMYGM